MKKETILLVLFFPLSLLTTSQNWQQLDPGIDMEIFDVFCIDPYNVYFTGFYGPLIKTTDGGLSFQIIDDKGFKSALYFINKDTGYVAGSNVIYRTEDGGNSWIDQSIDTSYVFIVNEIKMISSDTIIVNVDYFNSNDYYLDNKIYISYDAGLSWTCIFTSGPLQTYIQMHFFDNEYGYILENSWGNVTSKIYKTTDLGTTWSEIAVIEDIAGEIYFVDTLNGFIGGVVTAYSDAFIYKTLDGGITWDTVDVSEAHRITRFDFPEPSTGYFAGRFEWNDKGYPWGLVEMSDNGGNSWSQVLYSYEYRINSLDFISVDTGYIVGGKAVGPPQSFIIRTFDVEVSDNEIKDTDKLKLTAYPNPFNKNSQIKYKLANPGNLKFVILDIHNRKIKEFDLGFKQNLNGTLELDLSDELSGVYLCSLYCNGQLQKTIKIIKTGL